MSFIKTKEEIENLRESGRRLALILKTLGEKVAPGVSAKELDDLAFKMASEGGDKPAFLNYKSEKGGKPYPATLCVSVNEELVHTVPRKSKIFQEGDIVSIDMGVTHKGMITDSAITVPVGEIDKESTRLLRATEECLTAGIKAAKPGNFVGDIGFVVQNVAKKYKLSLAEGLAGHGVGYEVHEEPLIPNFGEKGKGMKLEAGMVIAIEPMLCEGSGRIFLESDGFTIRTADKKRCAHFEHTIAITEKGPETLTKFL